LYKSILLQFLSIEETGEEAARLRSCSRLPVHLVLGWLVWSPLGTPSDYRIVVCPIAVTSLGLVSQTHTGRQMTMSPYFS